MNKLIIGIVVVVLIGLGIGLSQSNGSAPANNNNQNSSSQNTQSPKPTGENEVSIINGNFSPASMSVKKGTTVKWINNDKIAHTVTENDGKNGPDSKTLNPGDRYSFTYNEAGVFNYNCTFHPDMTASVTVTE